jgi:hypothetical protein
MLGSPDNNSSTSVAGDRALQYPYPKILRHSPTSQRIPTQQRTARRWLSWPITWGRVPQALFPKQTFYTKGRYFHDRLFASLKPGWAEEVATSSPYNIKNTSVTPPTM